MTTTMMTQLSLGPAVRLAPPAFLSDLAAAFRAGWGEWRRRAAERQGMRALARLDDRLIRDMGLDPETVKRGREALPFGLAPLMPARRP